MSRRKGSSTTWVRRPHKYGVKTDAKGKQERTADGILFASKRERKRYCELKLLEKAGEIRELELQPRFQLMVPGRGRGGPYERAHLGDYVADFRYREGRDGVMRIEDVKGFKTPLYRWKKKHVEAQYGIEIREV